MTTNEDTTALIAEAREHWVELNGLNSRAAEVLLQIADRLAALTAPQERAKQIEHMRLTLAAHRGADHGKCSCGWPEGAVSTSIGCGPSVSSSSCSRNCWCHPSRPGS